jgi:hypothetical protein
MKKGGEKEHILRSEVPEYEALYLEGCCLHLQGNCDLNLIFRATSQLRELGVETYNQSIGIHSKMEAQIFAKLLVLD